jgi:two-component system, NarL family, response regulator NreC
MTIKVLLADDHQVVLEGYKALLTAEPNVEVVGEAKDGLEVLPAIERTRPDVLVLDLMMPGMSGLEVLRQLRVRAPHVKTVVVSMHGTTAYVSEALRNGAAGYVLKEAPTREVLLAISAVAEGKRYLSAPISESELEQYQLTTRPGSLDPYETLSTREREVFKLAAEGLTSAEIGQRLSIGKRTVETHRANLSRKLGLKSHADLVRLAVRRGLVAPE